MMVFRNCAFQVASKSPQLSHLNRRRLVSSKNTSMLEGGSECQENCRLHMKEPRSAYLLGCISGVASARQSTNEVASSDIAFATYATAHYPLHIHTPLPPPCDVHISTSGDRAHSRDLQPWIRDTTGRPRPMRTASTRRMLLNSRQMGTNSMPIRHNTPRCRCNSPRAILNRSLSNIKFSHRPVCPDRQASSTRRCPRRCMHRTSNPNIDCNLRS
jgi:hypothetical protein